jgi:hypothetical protein
MAAQEFIEKLCLQAADLSGPNTQLHIDLLILADTYSNQATILELRP